MAIEAGTYAEACCKLNSIEELEQALLHEPDKEDMAVWRLSASEWQAQVRLALFELYRSEYGGAEINGIAYALTQNAYINDDGCRYLAAAIDITGNDYTVHWNVTADDPAAIEDESDMCDWNKPVAATPC